MVAPAIPIKNLYYLLCYAWDQLEQAALIDVSGAPTTELVDLLAAVLCDGIRHLSRRGLEQGYQYYEEELSGVRGRIDLSSSSGQIALVRGNAICRYDDLTVNTLANQLIKSTLRAISRVTTLDQGLRKRVRSYHRGFRDVQEVQISEALFQLVQIHANNRFYRFLLNVCELVFSSLLVDQSSGEYRFRDFIRDERRMPRLFQKFLFNFAKRECKQWTTQIEQIKWKATSETDVGISLLPRMETDISLTQQHRHMIVDAKFYRETLSSYYDSEKVHSANLYQMISYLLNREPHDDVNVSGMLLYPQVDRKLRERYNILGCEVAICTMDLSQPWKCIDSELRELFS